MRESRVELKAARLLLDSSEKKSKIGGNNAFATNDQRCSRTALPSSSPGMRDQDAHSTIHLENSGTIISSKLGGAVTVSDGGGNERCHGGRLYGTSVSTRLSLVVDGSRKREGDVQAQERPAKGLGVGEASRNLRQDVAGVREARCHL